MIAAIARVHAAPLKTRNTAHFLASEIQLIDHWEA